MTKKQLRQRLEDLYCGASQGYPYDEENCGSIMAELGPEHFGGFLRAIEASFILEAVDENRPFATARHNLHHYTTMTHLVEYIWSELK